jgi:LysM repeat protein
MTKIAATSESKPATRTAESPGTEKEKAPEIPDSGKVYTVVRGDNPVSIARRFHVSYDALLALNQINDPRKLRIGTKLRIPERQTSSKHKSD